MDVGSEAVRNEQISTVSANGAEKSETCIDTLEPAYRCSFAWEKGSTQKMIWRLIPPRLPYLMKT